MNEVKSDDSDHQLTSSSSWSVLEDPEPIFGAAEDTTVIIETSDEICCPKATTSTSNPEDRKTKTKKQKKKRTNDGPSFKCISILLTISGVLLYYILSDVALSSAEPVDTPPQPAIPISLGNTSKLEEHPRIDLDMLDEMQTLSETDDDDVCPLDEEYVDAEETTRLETIIDEFIHKSKDLRTQIVKTLNLTNVKDTTLSLMSSMKNVLTNPMFHLCVYKVMHDVCIIKLIAHLSQCSIRDIFKREARKSSAAKDPKRKKKVLKKNKPRISSLSFDKKVIDGNGEHVKIAGTENGKSECERRFEELEDQWKFLGKNHIQKIQEIQEGFQSEILLAGNEGKTTPEAKNIKLIRERYIQSLRDNRELYLRQLEQLKEERLNVLYNLCINKEPVSDSKDAAVGNYAVLVPSSYDFHEKLNALKNQENSQVLKPNQAYTNLQQKAKDSQETQKKDLEEQEHTKPKKKTKKAKATTPELLLDDMISHLVTNMSYKQTLESKLIPLHYTDDYVRNILKPPKTNQSEDCFNNSTNLQRFQRNPPPTAREEYLMSLLKAGRIDLYEAAFDKNAEKVKYTDRSRWNPERFKIQRSQPVLSKQDPQKSHQGKMQVHSKK